ncbi:MAG TPA: hypothetical protein PLB48_12180 [Treponema sp.]|nr:hypothetical protein [Treponema sp.]
MTKKRKNELNTESVKLDLPDIKIPDMDNLIASADIDSLVNINLDALLEESKQVMEEATTVTCPKCGHKF